MQAPETHSETASKKAAMNGLAVVGFGALLLAGIFLAIYAARYVPETLSRLSSAVILSSDNGETVTNEEETPAEEEETPVTPEEEEVDTPSTGGPLIVTPPVVYPTVPQYYPSQPNLYGDADLVITGLETGYMRGSTFVEDDEVPNNRDAAVKFSVRNAGTNIAVGWRIRIDVEGERPLTGTGGALMPNGSQNFTLRIEDPEEGEELEVEIEVDYQDDVDESNERNNDRTVEIEIDN